MSDPVTLLVQLLGIPVAAAGLIVLLGYLGKETIAAALSRSVNRDLERLRLELNAGLEHLRHDLHLEAQKAELVASKKQEVYPEALSLLKSAHQEVFAFMNRLTGFRTLGMSDKAEDAVQRVKAFLEAKSLHFSKDSLELVSQAASTLQRAISEANRLPTSVENMFHPGGNRAKGLVQEAQSIIRKLEEVMRDELAPIGKPPGGT